MGAWSGRLARRATEQATPGRWGEAKHPQGTISRDPTRGTWGPAAKRPVAAVQSTVLCDKYRRLGHGQGSQGCQGLSYSCLLAPPTLTGSVICFNEAQKHRLLAGSFFPLLGHQSTRSGPRPRVQAADKAATARLLDPPIVSETAARYTTASAEAFACRGRGTRRASHQEGSHPAASTMYTNSIC